MTLLEFFIQGENKVIPRMHQTRRKRHHLKNKVIEIHTLGKNYTSNFLFAFFSFTKLSLVILHARAVDEYKLRDMHTQRKPYAI